MDLEGELVNLEDLGSRGKEECKEAMGLKVDREDQGKRDRWATMDKLLL